METIGTADLNNRLTELLRRTAHGESFEITMDGRAVGLLGPPHPVPAEPIHDPAAAAAAVERLKAMRGIVRDVKAADIRKMAHEGHKY